MITAICVKNTILVTIEGESPRYRLERHSSDDEKYLVYTSAGWSEESEEKHAIAVGSAFADTDLQENILYSYRCRDFEAADDEEEYSNWARIGGESAIGYTFGNYRVPEGVWGEVVTADDLRYTYLWGTDFKAANGQSFTDEQIRYFIDSATAEIERRLDISIKKQKIRCNVHERGLKKGRDYDIDEAVYSFRYAKIARYGLINTRRRPILNLCSIRLLNRFSSSADLTAFTSLDKTKGIIRLLNRPLKPSETANGIAQAVGMYGSQSIQTHLFYEIDYDAGFETSADIPDDLRQIIAKQAAVSLLNVIGDGLMAGFASSSLSMDGLSESFSSTQSATSATFGARIKEYKDDIDSYIKANRYKFANLPMGAI